MLLEIHASAQDSNDVDARFDLPEEDDTERAVDSWERYASWVNMKTGPTGKERYLSYGMYDLYDYVGRMIAPAREAAKRPSSTPELDAVMLRYMDAYERLEPVMSRAAAYYERRGYRADGMA